MSGAGGQDGEKGRFRLPAWIPEPLARRGRALWPVLVTLGDQAVHSGTNFLTGVVIGRMLSVGDLGVFSLGMTVVVFSLIFQDTLLATPYTYHFHNKAVHHRPRLTAGALIQSVFLAALFSLFFLLASGGALVAGEAALEGVFLALAGAMPLMFLREFFRRLFFTEFRMFSAALLDGGVSVLQFALLFAMLWGGLLTPATAYMAIGIAAGIGAVVCFAFQRDLFDFRNLDIMEDTRENLRYGRWLLAGSICHIGSLYAFPWFLYLSAGEKGTGAFAACMSIVNLLNPLIIGFTNFFRPRIIKTYADQGLAAMNRMIWHSCAFLLAPVLVLIVVLFFLGEDLVALVYGGQFTGLGTAISLVSLSLVPTFLNAPVQLGALAINRPWFNPIFHAAGFTVTVLAGYPLAVRFGVEGAAGGYVLTTLAGTAMLSALYLRCVRRMERAGEQQKATDQ